MSLLEKLRVKDFRRPMLLMLYGPIGCGKTSLGACFKDSAFVVTPKERGIDQVVSRGEVAEDYPVFNAPNWTELMKLIDTLVSEDHGYKTLVFDSLSSMQEQAFEFVCATKYDDDMSKFNHFCKGHRDTEGPWSVFMQKMEGLRDKGINVVLIAHATTRQIDHPVHGAYTMYLPDLYDSDKQGSLLKPTLKHCTDIGFIEFATAVNKEGKASGGTKRVLHFQRTAAWEAKNQRGIKQPIVLGDDSAKTAFAALQTAFKTAAKKGE